MPDLKTSPATATAAHAAASIRSAAAASTTALTPLQQAHFNAVARANKVAAREPFLLTSFALSDAIETLALAASQHFAAGETAAYIALSTACRQLTAILPVPASGGSV